MTFSPFEFGVVAMSFVVALATCHAARRFAERRALFDHPNDRSLHSTPIPRLGGVGVAVGAWAGFAALLTIGEFGRDLELWAVASVPVAGLGLIDDVRPLRAGMRFVVQVVVAAAFCTIVGVPTQVVLAQDCVLVIPVAASFLACVVWIVAVLNLFNFMDGMDGLAGGQSLGACLALAVAAALCGRPDVSALSGVLAAASAGFLAHNLPPARIFMGDGGSTFLGFTFAAIALLGVGGAHPIPVLVVPLALSPFLLDGTFTIFRRLSKGEVIWHAHRSHLYQRAVAAGLTHHDVLVPYLAWIAAAASAGVAASRASTSVAIGLGIGAIGALVGVWSWVRRCERASAVSPAR